MRRALPAIVLALASCSPHAATAPPAAIPARVDITRVLAAPPFAAMLARSNADLAVLQRATAGAALQNAHASITTSVTDINRRLNAGAQRLRSMRLNSITPSSGPDRHNFEGSAAAFARAAQVRVERAAELRAAQMREHEATIAYDFERAHAGQRLVLNLKLRDLHLDATTRQRYRQRLDALDRQEAALVGAARAADNATLASYRTQLAAQVRSNAASAAAGVVVGERAAQRLAQSSAHAAVSPPRWPATDLTQRFLALRGTDDAGRAAVRNEIAALRRDRAALRAQIVASVESRAAQVAAAQHLGRVYASGAPAGARDITDDVLRSYCVSTGSSDDGRCMK